MSSDAPQPEKRSQYRERIREGERPWHNAPGKRVEPPTDAEEAQIRDEFEEFIASSGDRLHLPTAGCDEAVARCDFAEAKRLRLVETAAMPPGFRPLCKVCVKQWRQERVDGCDGFEAIRGGS